MLLKFLVAFILLTHFGDAILKLPMKRHEMEGYKLLKQGRFLEYRALKNQHHTQKSRASRFSIGKSGLSGIKDMVYSVQVSFGTPPQTFRLFPDTTSTLTWIVDTSREGHYEYAYEYCTKYTCFNSTASSTYIKDGRTYKNSNTDVGFYGIDTVRIGDNANELTISNVTFGQSYGELFSDETIDGTLGLQFQSISKDGVESVFSRAVSEKLVDEPIFTIWINSSASRNESHGQITWGGLDLEHCSPEITYFPLTDKVDYEFNWDGYSINGGKKVGGSWAVLSRPLESYIYVPEKAYLDLLPLVNVTYDFNYGLYEVDCDVKFNWTVYSGDKTLKFNEKAGVFSINFDDGSTKCFLGIEPSSYYYLDVFILGNFFLKEYCVIHDISSTGQIGYARTIAN